MSLLSLLVCTFLFGAQPAAAATEPFVPVGVWYAGPAAQPPATALSDVETIRLDLAAIRRAGFNSITTWVAWRDAEPKRGSYVLGPVERLIAAAAQADLRTDVRLFAAAPPSWSSDPDTDRQAFIGYASKRLRLGVGVMSVEAADATEAAPRPIRVGRNAQTAIDARLAFWSAIAHGARRVMFSDADGGAGSAVLSLGETVGIVTRNPALFAPMRPRDGGVVDVSGAGGAPVDVKLLESPDALMIIGINYARALHSVKMTFTPDIPEAIWQNLETGTAVNFVMGRSGPFLEHTFAPRETLVLIIRKRLRQSHASTLFRAPPRRPLRCSRAPAVSGVAGCENRSGVSRS